MLGVVGVIIILTVIIVVTKFIKGLKKQNDYDAESKAIVALTSTFLIIIGLIFLAGLNQLLNPEYYALMDIINLNK